jgi:GT2 family glycosyltransferase
LLIELTYSKTASPFKTDSNIRDHRTIAIAWRSIQLEGEIYDFSLISKTNSRCKKIFGFYEPEQWGTWSAWSKSCILFSQCDTESRTIVITLEAHSFREAFRSCKVKIRTSTGHQGTVRIRDRSKYKVTLKRSIINRNSRLVIGDFSKIYSENNYSHHIKDPLVSIIALNQGKSHLSRLAIIAAASSGCNNPFEILCVDNGSSTKELKNLQESEVPMRLIKLAENKGFARANNLAAQESRGRYLLFLNNDAFLDEGAIDEMLMAFKKVPDCRIVGSVLRFPDSTMQEAGATLKSDGNPNRQGRNDPKFNPRKLARFHVVDYVSGACLMIKKSDFLEMGGFDEKYSPAYYEDTDLCMRALLYGQKVYLASRANCYHIENATTSSVEDGAWAGRTAEANRGIFLKDWGAYLESRDPKDLPWHLKK